MKLSVAKWKYDKDWVYSITYDEALADLHRFVIPCHRELGIPGHVEVVSGHIGAVRMLGNSSFNGMRHMNAAELRALIQEGWGTGNHSWSHGMVMEAPELELKISKETLEEAVGKPVNIYTAPGDNSNLTPEVVEKLHEYGYLGALSATDDVTSADADDLMWINRVSIVERYWGVFDSAYDRWKRIHQAAETGSWLVDICHCPLERPVHDYKDCSAEHHRLRLTTVTEYGKKNCWFANPDDVVDYRYMSRNTDIKHTGDGTYIIDSGKVPVQVQNRELSFVISHNGTPESVYAEAGGRQAPLYPVSPGRLVFTVRAEDGDRIHIRRKE